MGQHRHAAAQIQAENRIRVVRWHGGGAEVSVTAVAEDVARTVLALATRDAAVERRTDGTVVSMGFWHRNPRRGPHRAARRMSAARWAAIRANYAPATAAALDGLMAVTPETVHGHLVLLHGAPGTGKTTVQPAPRVAKLVPGGLRARPRGPLQ